MSGTLPDVPSQNDLKKVSIDPQLQSIPEEPIGILRPRPTHLELKSAIKKTSYQQQTPGSTGSYYIKNQYIPFLTLKILFVDLFVSLGNVGSDFAFGFHLLHEDHVLYGWISLAINWFPGITASIYVITMYRHELGPKRAVCYALLVFLLYPIVPTIAYIVLLWVRPPVCTF